MIEIGVADYFISEWDKDFIFPESKDFVSKIIPSKSLDSIYPLFEIIKNEKSYYVEIDNSSKIIPLMPGDWLIKNTFVSLRDDKIIKIKFLKLIHISEKGIYYLIERGHNIEFFDFETLETNSFTFPGIVTSINFYKKYIYIVISCLKYIYVNPRDPPLDVDLTILTCTSLYTPPKFVDQGKIMVHFSDCSKPYFCEQLYSFKSSLINQQLETGDDVYLGIKMSDFNFNIETLRYLMSAKMVETYKRQLRIKLRDI